MNDEAQRILLVEDDLTLGDWVREYLTEQGFTVMHCTRGEQGFTVMHCTRGDEVLACLETFSADLVLLDVMLPGLNGIEVCRQIRQKMPTPIIMLTARADEFDEVIGLEAGANDYVIKPVRPRALLARISGALKQSTVTVEASSDIQHGELVINIEANRVTYQGKEIELSTSLFAFLCFLARHAGEVVDRDTVFKALKNREYDGQDRRFDVMLSTLRKIFNDDPQKPQKFKTVWGKGYLFVADAWCDKKEQTS